MSNQITLERKEAYVEVLEVLKHMDKAYIDKIPYSLMNLFENSKSKDYFFKIDVNKPLAEQNLKSKSLEILGMLNLVCWCENEEFKQKLMKKYRKEEEEYKNNLYPRYKATEKILVESQNLIQHENMELVECECKESFFSVILKKIKNFFSKK